MYVFACVRFVRVHTNKKKLRTRDRACMCSRTILEQPLAVVLESCLYVYSYDSRIVRVRVFLNGFFVLVAIFVSRSYDSRTFLELTLESRA